MATDLSSVNISLSQFQAISSGKFNAGEVKLSGTSGLAKMNNHVHFRGMNAQTIPHDETLAIKEAFVRALASGGVGRDALNAVRRELGLAPDGKADRTLLERSMKPLSRQQIREILDRNAAAINSAQGVRTIVTDAQLHTGSKAAVRSIVRDIANAELDSTRKLAANDDVALAQVLIGGDVEFQSAEDRQELLKLARYQRGSILMTSEGKPSTDPNGTVSVVCDKAGGRTVTLSLGMSEAEYVNKLDDIILRLANGDEPSDEELAVREEFSSLKGGDRDAWLARLSADPAANGQKARAVAVMLLQDHGVGDFEKLSIVNSLDDADAIRLATALAGTTSSLKGDAVFRDSRLRPFAEIAASRPADVPKDSMATIPGLSAQAYNNIILLGLGYDSKDVPHAFLDMAYGVRSEMSGYLGVDALPTACDDGTSLLSGLLDQERLSELIPCGDKDVSRVTPESIRDGYMRGAMERGAVRLLEHAVARCACDLGVTITDETAVVKALLARSPNLVDQLTACRSPDEVEPILDGLGADPQFKADVLREHAVEECLLTSDGMALQFLADEFDLGAGELSNEGEVNLSGMRKLASELSVKIRSGEVSASTPDEVKAAFRDIARDFAASRADALRKLDTVQMPPEQRTVFRSMLLKMYEPGKLDIDGVLAAAAQVDFSEVAQLAYPLEPTDKALAAAGRFFSDVYEAAAAKAGATESNDDKQAIRNLVCQIAVARVPDGAKSLQELLGRTDVAQIANGPDGPDKAAVAFLGESLAIRNGSFAAIRIAQRPIERFFLDGPGAAKAIESGYLESELLYLAATFRLCIEAGMESDDAIAAVLDPQSKPQRLMRYGGRFTESAESFKLGLRLQNMFESWFAGASEPNGADGKNPFLDLHPGMKDPAFAGVVERFVFEDIAVNTSIPLDPTNPRDVFDARVNNATRFLSNVSDHALVHAVSHLPPTVRSIVFEAYNAVEPLALGTTIPEESLGYHKRTFVARLIWGASQLVKQRNSGPLTREGVLAALFPEFPTPKTNVELRRELEFEERNVGKLSIFNKVPEQFNTRRDFEEASASRSLAFNNMRYQGIMPDVFASNLSTCTAVNEAIPLKAPPSVDSFNADGMRALGNPAKAERAAMKNLIATPTKPVWRSDWTSAIPEESNHFVFKFQDGMEISCAHNPKVPDYQERAANAVADEIEMLCGSVHQDQLASVYRELSSDGAGVLVNFFASQGISTDSRCPLVQTISRDAATGAVSIVHSNPPGFPFNFQWVTTVNLDGTFFRSDVFFMPVQQFQQGPAVAAPQ